MKNMKFTKKVAFLVAVVMILTVAWIVPVFAAGETATAADKSITFGDATVTFTVTMVDVAADPTSETTATVFAGTELNSVAPTAMAWGAYDGTAETVTATFDFNTSALAAGDYDFDFVYVPGAMDAMTAEAKLTVAKKDADENQTVSQTSTNTFGQTLADVTTDAAPATALPAGGTFAWKDDTTALTTGTDDYTMVYTPAAADIDNYNPVEFDVSVTTAKADVTAAMVTKLQADIAAEAAALDVEFAAGMTYNDIYTQLTLPDWAKVVGAYNPIPGTEINTPATGLTASFNVEFDATSADYNAGTFTAPAAVAITFDVNKITIDATTDIKAAVTDAPIEYGKTVGDALTVGTVTGGTFTVDNAAKPTVATTTVPVKFDVTDPALYQIETAPGVYAATYTYDQDITVTKLQLANPTMEITADGTAVTTEIPYGAEVVATAKLQGALTGLAKLDGTMNFILQAKDGSKVADLGEATVEDDNFTFICKIDALKAGDVAEDYKIVATYTMGTNDAINYTAPVTAAVDKEFDVVFGEYDYEFPTYGVIFYGWEMERAVFLDANLDPFNGPAATEGVLAWDLPTEKPETGYYEAADQEDFSGMNFVAADKNYAIEKAFVNVAVGAPQFEEALMVTEVELAVGETLTLTPTCNALDNQQDGAGWALSNDKVGNLTFNSPATFHATAAGKTTVTYTSSTSGEVISLDITVTGGSTGSKTGDSNTMMWILAGVGAMALIAAAVVTVKKARLSLIHI